MTSGTAFQLSVIIPVHNGGVYLRQALESVLAQVAIPIEVIVLDDGSDDGSADILRSMATVDQRLRYVSRENRGLVVSLNELLGLARADIIARMDADDICMAGRFERQLDFLQSNPEVVCVGGQVELIDNASRVLGVMGQPLAHEVIDRNHMKGHTSICHPAAMYRAEAVKRVGGYDIQYHTAQDLDLWLRLAEVGRLANIPEIVIRYRIHSGSASEIKRTEQRDFARRAQQTACQRRGVRIPFEATDDWRPGRDRYSQHFFALKYAWMAWNHGHRSTCRHYACKALRINPWSLASWKLIYVALFKKPLETKR